ncbi:major capsid protein [Tortoise microvirus 102]|nr:major capsid protein [Tortoise microvirus 102]
MGKQPFISHVVNGYSRYDLPESKAFTCTPGVLYPVRIDFINARDRVTIDQGIDVRSNPLAVPTFNPYTVRLHRFWVPLQLYHAELRTNSSKFDMNNLSLNWIPATFTTSNLTDGKFSYTNSLLSWLRIGNRVLDTGTVPPAGTSLTADATPFQWANADTYLAYWDIVRNYYGYSQWSLYSFAWPTSWYLHGTGGPSGSFRSMSVNFAPTVRYFTQRYGNLEYLDAFFESQFYPNSVSSTNNTYNRFNLFYQIIASDLSADQGYGSGYPVIPNPTSWTSVWGARHPTNQFSLDYGTTTAGTPVLTYFLTAHPLAVVPSNPDRFSRLLPTTENSAVSTANVTTIPQLAVASRLQEYKDLLGAGGSRYSDWLETFFASKIEHVDRPKLLFSASQTVNVQIVMNQAGTNNFGSAEPLGQQGGTIAFNTHLGRRQSYYFREPGYVIDMFSIRPTYYWCSVRPDYLSYQGSDYFNPIYNDIGYQDVPVFQLAMGNPTYVERAAAYEPCFNEFRSSYDEVLGQISATNSSSETGVDLYSYWVQQRAISLFETVSSEALRYYPMLFVSMDQVNSPFGSTVEDNFFVNLSYSVSKKNLVNKTFATRLSNR